MNGQDNGSVRSGSMIDKYVLGKNAVLPLSQISMNQWSILFETNDGTQPAVLAEAIRSLRYQFKFGNQDVYKKIGKSYTFFGNQKLRVIFQNSLMKIEIFNLSFYRIR